MVFGTVRMRKMWGLLVLTTGPGALKMPPTVSKIEMSFSLTHTASGEGAGAFWKRILPALKYNNPTVPISLNRYQDPDQPGKIAIHFLTGKSSSALTTVRTVNTHDKPIEEILTEFKTVTKASPILMSDDDADHLRRFERIREIQKQTKVNMERSRAKNASLASMSLS